MAQQVNSKEEMTDAFQSANKKLQEQVTTKKPSLSKNAQYGLATAAVLLGGSAFAFTTLGEGDVPVEPNPPVTNPNTPAPTTPADSTAVRIGQPAAVAGGHITPNADIEIAHKVNDDMTFAQAYSEARQEVGAGGVFTWHGNVYNTYTKEEWQSMPLAQRQEFLSDVGFKPEIKKEEVKKEDEVKKEEVKKEDEVKKEEVKKEDIVVDDLDIDPVIKEVVIDGETYIGIDENGDGNLDALIKQDVEGNMTGLINMDGDIGLDTAVILDPIDGTVIEAVPLDEPVSITVDQFVALDQPVYDDDIAANDDDDDNDDDNDEDNDEDDDDDFDNNADVSDIA